LGEALKSILAQTFRDFEIIVVDDGSTDDTPEVVASFKDPRIRYIYQDNSGPSAAMNTGIRASSGELCTGLGADDIWLPEKLEREVAILDSHPEIALVCSDAYIFDNRTGSIIGRRWHDTQFHYRIKLRRAARQPLRELLSRGCFITPQAMLMRRRVFFEVGGFDESLRTHEDWDMFVRIVLRYPIEILDVPLVKIRVHDASLTADWSRMYVGATIVLNKWLNSQLLSVAELKILRVRLAHTHFSYGKSMLTNGKITLGREKLLEAIKVNPWLVKTYIYFAGSFLGNRAILVVKSLKSTLKPKRAQLL
jgi:glycosyltransferase involved in cell wall biosynthesis